MFLIRVSLPDRPGTLGLVASALGTAGADIHSVEIVGRDRGRVVDDFMVRLPVGMMPDTAVSACTTLDDVEVLWCSRYPAGAALSSDIEVLESMLGDPEQASEILTEAAPAVFHCHWAVLIDTDERVVRHATPLAPDLDAEALDKLEPLTEAHTDDLPPNWVPQWMETLVGIVPLAQHRAIVIGRHGGPAFLEAEMARLRYLVTLITTM